MSDGSCLARGCAVIAGLAVALFVAVGLFLYFDLRAEPQPNVAKAARSDTARAEDAKLTLQIDRQLGQLRDALPWATYLGTTVADVCSTSEVDHGFAITRDTWYPVDCSRTVTVYEAFDGDLRKRLAQLDTALAAAKWTPDEDPPGSAAARHALVKDFGSGNPVPNETSLGYSVPITSDYREPPGPRAFTASRATVDVDQAPRLPTLDDGTTAHDIALENPSDKTSYYVEWHQYSQAQLATAYPAHTAVLALSIMELYNTAPAPAPAATDDVD